MHRNPWPIYIFGFLAVLIVSVLLYLSGVLLIVVSILSRFDYLAEFIAGFMYSSFFTTPTAILFISILAKSTPPLQIAIIGGIGSSLADLIIFKLFRYLYFGSLSPLSNNKRFSNIVKKMRKSASFRALAPIIGGLIIASPLPDELGLAILGLSKINAIFVFILTFIFNTIGIFLTAYIAGQLL